MVSVEDLIERIMDAYSYEEFLELLMGRDEGYEFVAECVSDLAYEEDEET